ncbi:hypothetical protein Ancab_022598 [Ancistrocladus abbreviatus]
MHRRRAAVAEEMDGLPMESRQEAALVPTSKAESEDTERKARVDAVWKQMNKGVSAKTPKFFSNNASSMVARTPQKDKAFHNWMTVLGVAPKKPESNEETVQEKRPITEQNGNNDEAKKLAAAALAAVKDAAAYAPSVLGKVEVTEVRDFAGQDIEVKKFVDADSKEAGEKAKALIGQTSAVDAVLEQIKKKPRLSVLDKTKKDWGEFKQENRGLEEELDAYKKSANQYLDKVSFLERTDYREFERERDARLAMQARRRPDMHEDP